MKVLTVAIPCYNSQEYMKKAIESVLPGGDDVEIIVVDDGSKDNTKEIGAQYEKQYPGIVKLISKENGGHGSAVNAGLANASGVYYKVLDSDDWFDKKSLLEVLKLLKRMIHEEIKLDMLIANYVYEKPSAGKRRIINYLPGQSSSISESVRIFLCIRLYTEHRCLKTVDLSFQSIHSMLIIYLYISHFHMLSLCIIWMLISTDILLEGKISR